MLNKKRLTLITLVVLMGLASSFKMVEARSAEKDIKVWINDYYVMNDVNPFVEDNRTFVPVRVAVELFGQEVNYDSEHKIMNIGNDSNVNKCYPVKY